LVAIVPSAVVSGVHGQRVSVEVQLAKNRLPGYSIIGLPDASCRESRDRVRAAISASGFKWPDSHITVNLAPSGLAKKGAGLDLPIALGILGDSEQLPAGSLKGVGAVGELGLDGSLRPVVGLIAIAAAIDSGRVIVPLTSAREAELVRGGEVWGAPNLAGVVAGLKDPTLLTTNAVAPIGAATWVAPASPELADVRGQPLARWAIEVAAAGGHHLLMVGSPGAGKTMLASRLAGLLPDLSPEVALTATKVHSCAGLRIATDGLIRRPPFRAPHHGASAVALIGGGSSNLRPGEISCAHGGVLFLDELGEFAVNVLEALRQPLEEGVVRVSRAAASAEMPARFLLVGAMNPCPCGEGGADGNCRCSSHARSRYARRLSAPLLDRFDLRIEVKPPDPLLLLGGPPEETTATVGARVSMARELAASRGLRCNSDMSAKQVEKLVLLSKPAKAELERALIASELTGRGLRRVRVVARTIADLAGDEGPITAETICAGMMLRSRPVSVLGGAA
jgi:magnesium chelatase family protein